MKVGRFQVMATLQAARAHLLGLPIDSAKSFGLNRAIFYAAAKRGFKTEKGEEFPVKPNFEAIKGIPRGKIKELQEKFRIFSLGDEQAYSVEMDGRPFFIIGNEIQTPEAFRRQIESRFSGKFQKAFEEALEICKQYDKGVLMSQRYFFETVYKPRRDLLAQKWTEMVSNES
ncbi:MAG TPA: hypothetical protein PKU94_07295 [Candidatus Hydrothermia bacterium]|nr:hypothetical protein [Candidatus Hydrothermae bacterium]MDD3649735.1 hypothetical protein [Candidatus Hydrothermia bacterium]MDD5572654.1 hypothetical protein [Candidatus Hydrothermia bacterium]HOK23643.1 hypothetical protein [Candidatus Hydrothermia bacterium]HOL24376.1 hypothetical protein [Candidatus Hydrothermia bacterium]